MIDSPAPTVSYARRLAIRVCVIGMMIRLALSSISIGSNDTETWMHFGLLVKEHGLAEAYHRDAMLNHPPLPTLWATACYQTTCFFNRFWNPWPFSVIFRLPVIAADAGACYLLWRILSTTRTARHACLGVCLLALSPANILISAYHSNTDSICITIAMGSLLMAHRGRWLACGLVMGLAINIKIVPVLLIPALIAACPWRQWWQVVGGLAVGAIPFLLLALASGWQPIVNIVGYGSSYAQWGVVGLLELSVKFGVAPTAVLAAAQAYHDTFGKWTALAVVVLVGLLFGFMRQPLRAGATVMACFLALSPGFGVQYLVYAVTSIIAMSLRWGLWIVAICGAFAGSVYYVFLDSHWPLRSIFKCDFLFPVTLWGLLAWLAITSFAAVSIIRALLVSHDPDGAGSRVPALSNSE